MKKLKNELTNNRKKIDLIDRELIKILNKRYGFSLVISQIKREMRLPLLTKKREVEILANVVKNNNGPLPDIELRNIFKNILIQSRKASLKNK
ncbi:MAG: chorismate mutase [Bacteroidota bacterium]